MVIPVDVKFTDYKTVKEASEEWSVTERRVVMLLNAGRIPGAVKKGFIWLIPVTAPKPEDRRRKEYKQPEKEEHIDA